MRHFTKFSQRDGLSQGHIKEWGGGGKARAIFHNADTQAIFPSEEAVYTLLITYRIWRKIQLYDSSLRRNFYNQR